MSDKRHPKTTFSAQYPYNRITISESGHEEHFDDTPGKERIRRSHKSGTYEEISHDGKWVTMAVGNRVEYSKQGKTTTVDKNHDEKIGGSVRTSVGGGSHTEIKGGSSMAVDGDSKTMIGGHSVTAVKGDMTSGVTGKSTFKMGGDMQIKGDGKKDIKIDGAANLEFGDIFSLKAASDISITSDTKITLEVGGSRLIIESDHVSIIATTVYLNGGAINVKFGSNKATPDWVSGASDPPD